MLQSCNYYLQDPYVVLNIDKWTARTCHLEEAGASAVWDNIDGMQTPVTGLVYIVVFAEYF